MKRALCLPDAKVILVIDQIASNLRDKFENFEKDNKFIVWKEASGDFVAYSSIDELPFIKQV